MSNGKIMGLPGSASPISGVVGEPTAILATARYVALTVYGVEIMGTQNLADKAAALAWAKAEGDKFPRCRLVRQIGNATRTIWRQQADRWAA